MIDRSVPVELVPMEGHPSQKGHHNGQPQSCGVQKDGEEDVEEQEQHPPVGLSVGAVQKGGSWQGTELLQFLRFDSDNLFRLSFHSLAKGIIYLFN